MKNNGVPVSDGWRGLRGYRPGMALRVAIGFAAVALTVLAANVVTQQGARDARERVRTLLLHHEPLVRATEALAAAVSLYERTVVDQSEASNGSEEPVQAAGRRMMEAAREYAAAAAGFPQPGAAVLPVAQAAPQVAESALGRELEEFRAHGEELVRLAQQRSTRLRQYWRRFDQLEARLNAPHERAVRVAGAVFASESLMELTRALGVVRDRVSAAASVEAPRSQRAIVASENAFRASLRRHSAELAAVHGQPWLDDITRRYAGTVQGRRAAFSAIEDYDEHSVAFRDLGARVAGLTVTQLVEPARRALADADRLAMLASAKADRRLLWASGATLLLLLLIAVATVTSVTAPVRRLTEATRKLAGGAVLTRVARGGVRELDALAAAFNQMAEQLQQAQDAVRADQLELESKVDERTRELNHLAYHDPLTDLPNRRQFAMHLDAALARAGRGNERVALLFIDLDNFKTINDSLGHAYGDRVLQAVSERLRLNGHFARSFSARLGGDEFTIVCEDVASLADVERLCGALIEEFQRPLSVRGRELRISVSVGASVYPDHAADTESLLRAADAALFRAKELGRNCWSLFLPELIQAASARFKIEQSLRRAIEHGELELLYQPEACFETMQTHAVEALLRWRRPDGSLALPTELIDVAERSGLITEVSEWVLRTAIQEAARWQRGPWPQARVAVNVSSQQFLDGDFVDRLQDLLRRHALPAACLEIELTETVLQTGPTTIAALHRLRELGVSIALDDFGTGYSSLTSLERLPLTRVKIDRSLISAIDGSGRSPAIVRSIIGLCRSLGLKVTAEGVERPSQLAVLLMDRAVYVQGFLVSRPIEPAAVAVYVARAREELETLARASPGATAAAGDSKRLRVLRPIAGRSRAVRDPLEER